MISRFLPALLAVLALTTARAQFDPSDKNQPDFSNFSGTPSSFSVATVPGADEDAMATLSLVAGDQAAVPGQDYSAVFEIDHSENFHSYWENWGSAGYAVEVDWTLPGGVTASELEYAVPHQISTSGLPGYGYEGVTRHLVHFSIPADTAIGTNLTLEGEVNLLICNATQCVPLMPYPVITLTVPVATEAGAPSADLLAAREHLPQSVDWPAHWLIDGTKLAILVETPDAETATKLAAGTYFGAETAAGSSLTDLNDTPELSAEGTKLTVRVALSEDAIKDGVEGVTNWSGLLLENPDGEGAAWRIEASPADKAQIAALGAAQKSLLEAAGGLSGLWKILGGALLGGLILNIMPCVFPVLGLKVMGVVSQAGEDRKQVVLHGIVYTIGVLVSFWILTAGMIALQKGGDAVGVGFQLQDPYFLYGLVFVLFFFALNLFGLFEVGTSLTTTGGNLQNKQSISGSFFTGILATVVATPCMAPFLGAALGAALQLPPVGIFAAFTAMGLGLALPFLLLSIFPALVERLPRPGPWMESFKVFMSFLLFGATGFLVFSYAGLMEAGSTKYLGYLVSLDAFLALMLALTLLALGGWIYGRWGQQRRGKAKVFGVVTGLVLAVLAVVMAIPHKSKIIWEPWSVEREAQLQEANTPYLVDFTAAWCATCQTNKLGYVDNPKVISLIESKGIVMLKADWTDRNNAIGQRLSEFERAGVPTNILWYSDLDQPELFPETFGAGTVIEHFEEVPDAE